MKEKRTEFSDLSSDDFICGESIYLRIPNIENDIINGNWHSWFNDPDVTKYLVHGVYPIDRFGEAKLVEAEMKKTNSLLLCIIQKTGGKHIGVISLKNIDLVNRTAEIAIVMGPERSSTAAIEAMAVIMKHAFERLNLSLLYAGQHEALWKWVNTLSLIGFKIDGFRKNAGFRNGESYGIFLTSVSSEDFFELQQMRNGKVLTEHPMKLLRARKKENPLDKLINTLDGFNVNWT